MLKDVVDIVTFEVERAVDVVIVGPPARGEDSDVELKNDENLTENNILPDDVTGEIDIFEEEEEEGKEAEVQPPKKNGEKDEANPEWKTFLQVRNNENIRTNEEGNIYTSNRLHEEFPEVQHSTEWSVLLLVFDDNIDLLVQSTNLYASRDKIMNTKFKVSKDKINNFTGLLLLSGYNCRSNANDYWSTVPDLSAPFFAETMIRKRFRDSKRYLHVYDNMNLDTEKMAKIIPIYNVLNSKK